MAKNSIWRASHYLFTFFILIPACLLVSSLLTSLAMGATAMVLMAVPYLAVGVSTVSMGVGGLGMLQILFRVPITVIVFIYGFRAYGRYISLDLQGAGRENDLQRQADEVMRQWDEQERQESATKVNSPFTMRSIFRTALFYQGDE